MQFWKPHALAKPHAGQLDLRTGDKVRAIIDLPDVAEGATGKVILANGFNWQRYRVLFTDGTELGDLDQRTHRADRPGRQAPGQGRRQGLRRSSRTCTVGALARRTPRTLLSRPGSSAAW